MGFLGKLITFAFWRFIEFLVIFFVITLVPWFPPDVKITSTTLTPTKPVDLALQKNLLNDADHVFVDKLIGAECFIEYKGFLYTGVHGGEVVKISPQHHVTSVIKFGKPCVGVYQEQICGRPLGLSIVDDVLYVADAYYGLWKVNLINGRKELLVSPEEKVDGVVPKIFNSIAVASNGDIFWSHSSSDFHLYDGLYTMFADGSGRLIQYDAKKKSNKVLLTDLWFANGVALSPDEEFILVAETVSSRIGRYYLNGPKKGQKDIFADGLAGLPDNIQVLPDKSGLLVAMIIPVNDPHLPVITRNLAPLTLIRKFVVKGIYLIEKTIETFNQWYPHEVLEKFIHKIGHFSSMTPFTPKGSYIGHYDWDGNLLELWYGDDESVHSISDAFAFNGKLYLGSPYNNFIAIVPLPDSLKNVNKKPVKVVEETAKKTAQKTVPKTEEPPKKIIQEKARSESNTIPKESLKVEQVEKKQATVKPIAEKPAEQKPIAAKPVTEKPAPTKPVAEKPAPTKPVAEKPTPTKPVAEKPVPTKPVAEKPVPTKPVTEKPAPTKPVEEKPIVAKPVAAKPTEAKPVEPKPVVTKPAPQQKPEVKSEKLEKSAPSPQVEVKPSQGGGKAGRNVEIVSEDVEPAAPKVGENTKPVNDKSTPKATAASENNNAPKAAETKTNPEKQKNPEPTPIVEEIKSDIKPPQEPVLKVIQKDGPAELPNPSKAKRN